MVAALYRRYRPEAFAEMIGQSQVTEPLMTALRTGRIGHAYLFSGPRGCGKTTSARILARCLNCAEGPTDTPCGTCPSCVELSRDGGGSLDVVEIDAASHGGVDDARDLRERAVFAPARDRFKIFIIDEAHMVTPGGFNALLKIVEEPPPHVKFIFATTEPDKVIGTIRSRTHHYPFRLIAPGTLIDYVQALCDSESVQVEPGVLPLVVRSGGGSVRDTLSILDQLIAGSEGSLVTAERAAGLLGFTHAELLDDVVVALGAHDAAAAFRATDRVVQTGQDPRRFVEDLLERLRDLIVVSATTVDGAAAVFRGVPQDQLTRMFAQSQSFARGELSRIADTVSGGLDKMAGATAPRLQLELMIARALVAQEQNAARSAATSAGATAPVASEEHASRVPGASGGATAPVAQEQNAARSAATGAGATAPASAPPSPARPAQSPEAVPERPAHDPLAALAAARSAVTDPEPAASQGAPQQGTPNAAQTAASIREFLRDEPAAAGSEPVAAAPASDAPASDAPASHAGSAQRSAPASGSGAAPHPNEGAAGFGRPISDILSSSQIASIGTESPTPATPTTATSAVAAQPAATPSEAPAVPTAGGPNASESSAGSPESREQSAPASSAESDGAGAEEPSSESGLDDLLELWPDLLEEILERDREAWNAVRPITPMGLDGDVLTIGLASQSDLAAFKSAGAGPLRETILSAVGISVKYVPKRLPEGGSDGPPQSGARETQPGAADAEEPHPAGSSSHDDPVQRAAARLSALGPALAAPAWADPPPAPPEDVAAGDSTVPEDVAASVAAPESPQPTSAPEPSHEPERASQTESQPAPVSAQEAASLESGTPYDAVSNDAVSNDAVSDDNDPADEAPEPLEATRPDPSVGDYVEPADDPYGEGDPYAGGDPYDSGTSEAPASASMSASEPVSVPPPSRESAPARGPAPAPASAPPSASQPSRDGDAAERETPSPRMAPAFTRYGEAVVREVLGARFIEERPLPPRLEG